MTNKINKSNLHFIILGISFIILIYVLNPNFTFDTNYIKHWSTYHHDDIVFVYNSLLYAEGLEQHHLDHPSLFTFIIFPIFYKLAFYIGYIDFYNLSGFLQSEDTNLALSKLFFISRFSIQLLSFGVIVIVYKIVLKFSTKNFDSFFISLCLIFSTGFTSSSNRIESGLIAVFFALIAFYFFIKFIEKNHKLNLIYLILVFLFIFSSMMQKKIIYFALPFLFLSSFVFLKRNKLEFYDYRILSKFYINYRYLLFSMYLFVLFFISYKTIINNTFFLDRDLDFIFLVLNYTGFNLLFYLYIKIYQNKYYKNLLTYNLIFGCTYIIYKYFLIYFFSAPIAIWSISFTNFLGQLNIFSSTEDIKGAFDFSSLALYGEKFIENLQLVVIKYFFSFSFQAILIWVNLILFLLFSKKIQLNEKISVYTLFFGFLFVQSVILFRYEQDTYFLNSEFFLLFSLSILLRYLKINISYILGSLVLIILLFFSNLEHYKKIKKDNASSLCPNLIKNFEEEDNFYEYWIKKIPLETRSSFCNDQFSKSFLLQK